MGFFVEFSRPYCLGLHAVMRANRITNYTLACEFMEDAKPFLRWAHKVEHIDLVHLDLQMFEYNLFKDAEAVGLLDAKAYRLVVATHAPWVHAYISDLYSDWIRISSVLPARDTDCVERFLCGGVGPNRSRDNPEKFNWDEILRRGCYYQSPRGKVVNWDGQLILDNPRFVDTR